MPIDYGVLAKLLMGQVEPVAMKNNPLSKSVNPMVGTEGARVPSGGGGRAKAGGETGVNGFQYKGGQFLPSTDAPPGTWRVGGKLVKARKMQLGPSEWATQPSPTARSIYQQGGLSAYTARNPDGSLRIFEGAGGQGIRDSLGRPITSETKTLGNFTLGDLLQMYNKGMRWVDLPE